MKGIFKSRLVLTGVALVLLIGALGIALVSSAHSHTARAYGKANWQAAFSGTFVTPGSGGGGFWGWCDFGGGVNSGNTGDCEFSQYFHAPAGGGLTCEVSMDITSWVANGDFIISGTATAHPASATALCLSGFPGSANFSGVDSGIPAAPGHYNLGGMGAVRGEIQIQVVQIP
jgi:hypothetical protein